ncbi:RNA polymerase sigma-70 factor [Kitasatospora viridis]|uniref:RNA polymerase sigma-70 factor n=1 Tax=Kitasatospora viridis TaxID=281105 RepID=UPI0011A42DCA|nr:RNA polymerase sigma-70 factor [Kitasatospora viridis]
MTTAQREDPFLENRRLLFGTAYRMLGSVADAEDVLQDAWLKWAEADRSGVLNPRAYLVRTVTNLSLNKLTSARARRESYVGTWLPEPLLTAPDVAEDAELAESVSLAMLVVLETLSPLERAVFVLREVFGYSNAELAETLGKSEAAVRQLAHRAKAHVQERRPRFETGAAERRAVTERFLAACGSGEASKVMELLAPEVVSWSDGGGVVRAALRPIQGSDRVARWALGVLAKPELRDATAAFCWINGEEGVLFTAPDGSLVGALAVEVLDGVVHTMRCMINPAKLDGLRRSEPFRF